MLTIGIIALGVDDMRRAVDFWAQALGYAVDEDETTARWTTLVSPDGDGVPLGLMLSETPVQAHPREHLDLYVEDAAAQAAEVERLVGLGAERVDWDLYPEDPDFVVLADPEGNRFCVVDRSHA
ncbi:MAG TPA: VOC family protein [Mycobacteriales bacterium]|jgi:predicted enzyme related to lactoylglutathione lyase